MQPEKNYLHRGWIALTALIAVLVGVSFIPPQSVGGVRLRRANILSDLFAFEDAAETKAEPALFDEEEFHVDMEQVAELIVADSLADSVRTTFAWSLAAPDTVLRAVRPDTVRMHARVIPIEDYDTTGMSPMKRFYEALLGGRGVRIAVLGDSFIEGDILTADLREKLQCSYGGGGTGFAPMASPLTAFRRTVRTQARGWNSYNIMQRQRTPEALRGNYYVSGWVCSPETGASTRWESTDARERLDSVTTARVLFLATEDARVEATLNDTLSRSFDIEGDPAVRQLLVTAPHIRSLSFKVNSGAKGFIGYGATFEGDGVTVDNYSVRSNNGQAMFWTNPSVNAQMNALLGYDLVVLQYGLNIMQAGVHAYNSYGRQVEKMVAYVRQCFPGAAVLVLGVSDRSVKGEAGFEPMDAVPYMTECQRRAARNTGAAFWPTSEAMQALGGMERFVANGWAGKDYTHINYAGGRQVALALFDAINAGLDSAAVTLEAEARRREAQQAVIDSLHLAELDRQLFSPDIALERPANTSLQ